MLHSHHTISGGSECLRLSSTLLEGSDSYRYEVEVLNSLSLGLKKKKKLYPNDKKQKSRPKAEHGTTVEVTVRSPGQKTKVSLQSPSKGDDSQVPPTFWVVNQSLADQPSL